MAKKQGALVIWRNPKKKKEKKRSEKFAEGEKRVQGGGHEWKMGNVAQGEHSGLGLNAVRRHQSARLIRGEGAGISVHATGSYGVYGYQYPDNATQPYGVQDQRRGSYPFRNQDKSAGNYSDVSHVLVRATRAYKTMEAIKGQKKFRVGRR